MTPFATLGDTVIGNILSGTISSVTSKTVAEGRLIARIGDIVTVTGIPPGQSTPIVEQGTITSGEPSIVIDGSPVALIGKSTWVSAHFAGIISGPGALSVRG